MQVFVCIDLKGNKFVQIFCLSELTLITLVIVSVIFFGNLFVYRMGSQIHNDS